MKLNLACGDMILDGYINCDLYNPKAEIKCDVKNLPFEDNTFEYIFASHIIEHFDFYEAFDVLKEWYRVLKPGGVIHIETPDLYNTCQKFIKLSPENQIELYGHFFATPWIEGQVHKFLYTEIQLNWTLEMCGFINIKKVTALRYINNEDINLGMEASK